MTHVAIANNNCEYDSAALEAIYEVTIFYTEQYTYSHRVDSIAIGTKISLKKSCHVTTMDAQSTESTIAAKGKAKSCYSVHNCMCQCSEFWHISVSE